ncbi:hypothetical protein JNN96_32935 [Mycobacterium sp. DSM 3803]|nr:hypothetical protein [Mycobacterium sp. DSM 3803]
MAVVVERLGGIDDGADEPVGAIARDADIELIKHRFWVRHIDERQARGGISDGYPEDELHLHLPMAKSAPACPQPLRPGSSTPAASSELADSTATPATAGTKPGSLLQVGGRRFS